MGNLESIDGIKRLQTRQPLFWINPALKPAAPALASLTHQKKDMIDANQRWMRFAPLLAELFPETKKSNGIIESDLLSVPHYKKYLEKFPGDKMILKRMKESEK